MYQQTRISRVDKPFDASITHSILDCVPGLLTAPIPQLEQRHLKLRAARLFLGLMSAAEIRLAVKVAQVTPVSCPACGEVERAMRRDNGDVTKTTSAFRDTSCARPICGTHADLDNCWIIQGSGRFRPNLLRALSNTLAARRPLHQQCSSSCSSATRLWCTSVLRR